MNSERTIPIPVNYYMIGWLREVKRRVPKCSGINTSCRIVFSSGSTNCVAVTPGNGVTPENDFILVAFILAAGLH